MTGIAAPPVLKGHPAFHPFLITKKSAILFTSLWVMGLFLRSKAPGLVFSVIYPWGILAPSAFPSTSSGLRLPPSISHEKHGGLPPVTPEKPHNPRASWHIMKTISAPLGQRAISLPQAACPLFRRRLMPYRGVLSCVPPRSGPECEPVLSGPPGS